MTNKLQTTLLLLTALAAGVAAASHWDGGRKAPVHRLALNDEFGDAIIPGAANQLPVSTRKTCGQCHDYDAIASGWHFNMSDTNALPGRPGQPWFMIDALTGSQIPMSLRNWPGVYKPEDIGMTHWQWVLNFGRHLPGGDIADPKDLYAEGGEKARWDVSGPLEINCFVCHSQSRMYDQSEWVRLITRQNFRWAATGALGLGEVLGMGSRVPEYWGAMRGPNKDDKIFAVPPSMQYDARQFDAKNRAVLDLDAPTPNNCENCHQTSQVGLGRKDMERDVHLRAGMACVDCHRNGEDHKITRGYEGEAQCQNKCPRDKAMANATCVGCHVAKDGKAGRYGAPVPKHVGFPLVHFEKLACTTCHSGVTQNGELALVSTTRANRMGVYGRARWATPQPFIIEPVFVKNAMGKIEPRRMVWPAFWATRDAKDAAKLDPIAPEEVQTVCAGLFDVREQVGKLLAALATDPNIPGTPVASIGDTLFAKNPDGIALPVEGKGQGTDWYYQTATNLVAVVPAAYNPEADTEKMKDEEINAYNAVGDKLKNLLQTLDAAGLTTTNEYGAVVLGGKVFWRGGADDAMIYTNAPAGVADRTIGLRTKQGAFRPLIPATTLANAKELGGSPCTLTENMVAEGLQALAKAGRKGVVYVAHGQVWELGQDGKLAAKVEKAAEPVSWAVGHDVRPARMARGAKPVKCADCHTVDSKFFFGKVASTGPLLTSHTLVKAQADFMGISGGYNKLLGTTFLMRPVFKIFLWVVFAILILVAVAFAAAGVPVLLAAGGIPYGKKSEKLVTTLNRLSGCAMGCAGLYLGLSGAYGWFSGHGMSGYLLIFHMVAGGLFAAALLLLIWFRGKARIATKRSLWWMLAMALGTLVVFTAVAPMMTIFGSDWQQTLLMAHRCSTFCFLAVGAWMLINGGRKE